MENKKTYKLNGNVPQKYILRPYRNSKENKQSYFSVGNYSNLEFLENEDFNLLNNSHKNIIPSVLMSIKNSEEKTDIIVDNTPIKLKIIGVENQSYRQNGSNSSIRVLLPQGYSTLISSDVLLESLFRSGCDVNGDLKDNFIVISNGKNLMFVRENSGMHLAAIEHMEHMAKPKMAKMSFNTGSIYKTATGSEALFLGYVTTLIPKLKVEFKDKEKNDYKIVSAKYEFTNVKSATLWYPFSYYTIYNRSLTEAFQTDMKSEHFMGNLKLVVGNAHSFINKSDREPVDMNVIGNPAQIVYAASNSAEKHLRKKIKTFQDSKVRYPHLVARWYNLDDLKYYLKYLSLELFGLKAKEHVLVKELERDWLPYFISEHNNKGCTNREP